MALYVGDTKIKRVYHGDTPIKRIYYGDTLVWAALGVASGLSSTRNNTSFTPAWAAVEDADSYDLRWSTNANMSGATTVTGTTSGTAVTGLSALTTYYWEVRANEGDIVGDWSATQNVTTTGALSGLSSTRTRTSFTPSWTAIAGLAYDMRYSTNSDMTGATTVTGTTSGTAVTGLNTSTTYYWEVRSKRGSTLGEWSSTQSVTTQDALTAPARGAAPSASPQSRTEMRWTATAPNNGGSAITGYDWRWRRVGAAGWTAVNNGGATLTRTGLTAGTQYEAQFKAKNSIGTAADWSPSGTGTTTAASAPARGAAPSANGGNQQVAWTATAPSNGGSAITHYLWRWRRVGAVSWRTTVTTTGRTFTRTGLTANTQYEAQFKARNSIGDAASWSPSGRATTDAVVQLPVAAAPSVSINAIPSGDEGTTVRLSRTLNGGTYDQYQNAWSVDEGTLDDATADSPTWTRPAVSATKNVGVNYGITVRGTGTTARAGTSASASATEVQAQVRDIVSQSFVPNTLVARTNNATTKNIVLGFNQAINEEFFASGNSGFLYRIAVQILSSGTSYNLQMQVSSSASPATDLVRRDLSSAFENGWRITISVGASSWVFNATDFGSDAAEPYFWSPQNATARANILAAFNALDGARTNLSTISVTLAIP